MIDVELDEEMGMPTLCQKCGKWFDLNDGTGSEKWFPNTVICQKCGDEEEKEIERDEEIEDLKSQIDDAEFTIKECRHRLTELGVEVPFKINTPSYWVGSIAANVPQLNAVGDLKHGIINLK